MAVSRRGAIRGAIAALFAPAAAATGIASGAPVHPGEWADLSYRWQELARREGRMWQRMDALQEWENALIRNAERDYAEVRRRERMLELRERFLGTFSRWIDWREVSDWGGQLADQYGELQ